MLLPIFTVLTLECSVKFWEVTDFFTFPLHFLTTFFPWFSYLLSSSLSFQIHTCLLVISAGIQRLKIKFSVSLKLWVSRNPCLGRMSQYKSCRLTVVCESCRLTVVCCCAITDHCSVVRFVVGVTLMVQLCSSKNMVLVLLGSTEELSDWCISGVRIT